MVTRCKKVRPQKLEKSTVSILWKLMFVILGFSLFSQFLIQDEKHYFELESVPFFYAIFGFVSCFAIIFISKFLGYFFKRNEDYYKK